MAQYNVSSLRAEYLRLWNAMEVTAQSAADKAARRIISYEKRYRSIEARTGVPWYVVGLMHLRESNFNFRTWLHNGDPMFNSRGELIRTVRVPAGYPRQLRLGMSFEDGAYDALVTVKGFDKVKLWDIAQIAYVNESYNGFGYRHPARNIPSPYLWGGTNIQKRGKFIRDGVYDAGTWDTQLGVMAVLRRVFDITGITVPGDKNYVPPKPSNPNKQQKPRPIPVEPIEDPKKAPPPLQPKAEEPPDAGVRPPTKSVSVWATIMSALSGLAGIGTALTGIDNPWALAGLGLLLITIIASAIIVIRNYAKIRQVIEHISEEKPDGTSG